MHESLQNGEPSVAAQAPRPPLDSIEHDESHPVQSLSQPTGTAASHVAAVPAPRGETLQVPRLTPSKSAPAEIDAMVRRTPSQDATTMTRALSFNGYAGGDTQPMESQIYRDYTESMTRSSGTTPKKTILHFDANAMNDENTYGTTGRTQHTMDQGDDGFVDLDGAWHREDSPGAKSATSGIEELLAGPETQSQNNFGANGSFAPRTPGLTSDQRRRSGDIPTSATDASGKTPAGFSQMFAMNSKLPTLSATQLFDQTQAPSSPTAPVYDVAHSDPIADRPSPNMHTNDNLSPHVASSSPMLMLRNPPASTAGEPRDTYTSMRESQERRAARLRQDLELQNRFGPDAIAERGEDDEDDTQEMRLDRQRLQRVLSDQAIDEWSRYRAPSRPGHGASSANKKTTTIDLVTPGTLHKQGRVQFDLLDDEQDTDEDDGMEIDLPVEVEDTHDGEGVPDVEGNEDGDDDNDVYDEYGQTVLRSQRDPDDEEDEPQGHEDRHNDNETGDEERSTHDDDDEDENETKQDIDMHGAHDTLGEVTTGTQPAVADSQPERLEAQRSLLMKDSTGQHVTSSIIPGSQYVGATSQDLARHSNRVPNSSTLSQQFIQESSKSQTKETRVPSSPPVPAENSAEQGDDSESSQAERGLVPDVQPGRWSPKDVKRNQREIPESDQPDCADRNEVESAQEETMFETAAESNAVAPFSTAQTHLEESGHTPKKPKLVKELSKLDASQQSMPTPLRAAGVRRFADIAGDPSPPEFSGESQLDMDAIMGNVISMDDQNFMDVLSSPPSEKPTKRRRLLPSDSSKRRSRLPSMELAGSESASESVFEPSSPVKAAAPDSEVPARFDAPIAFVEALRASPKKAIEVPSATPEETRAPDTPESVRRREEAGSKAASQLLSARPAFDTNAVKSKNAKPGRKSTGTRAAERKPVSRRASSKLRTVVEKAAEETNPENTTLPNDTDPDQIVRALESNPTAMETTVHEQALAIEAPERVLARFTGVSYNAYYPATWLSTAANGKSHVIRFDDTTTTSVDAKDVRSLDLRINDAVRIDYEGYRSKTWLIKSFGRKALDDADRANGVDIHGHATLHVQAKVTQRSSMPAPGAAAQSDGDIAEVMVTNVKITHNMIAHFADRIFYSPNGIATASERNQTPSAKGHSFDAETPSRSTRRAAASTTKSVANEPSKLREASVATASEVADAGMFEGMAFAISYASNESEKFDVTGLIRRNGGLILEQGFDELFIQPQLDDQLTPTKRPGKTAAVVQSNLESGSLKLKPEYEKLGFIALIADKHSRRAKYMQALALDLPTLSGRWIIDSFDASRNAALPSSPRPWTRYLLPAGESSYLGGAIRSRTLQYYNPASAKLPATVASRALLLGGAGVLLVAPKKGKGTWERRKAYAFLTLALGAGSVRRVADLAEAKKLLASDVERQKWAWVYVDDDAGEAAKVLFGAKGSGGGNRKRKRNDGPQMCVEGMQGRVRVVGDEFVVQSLILGALVD